jgi:hypothetical protein
MALVDIILIACATVTTLIVSVSALIMAYTVRDMLKVVNYIADLMEHELGLRGDNSDG